jgi:hypothetical protein
VWSFPALICLKVTPAGGEVRLLAGFPQQFTLPFQLNPHEWLAPDVTAMNP